MYAAVFLAIAAGCDASGSGSIDDVDARSGADEPPDADPGAPDARSSDAQITDAGPTGYQCEVLELTPAQTCAIVMTGVVTPCSIDADTGQPSQTGSLEVRRPDGSNGYLCSSTWSSTTGAVYGGDPEVLLDSPAGCCGGADGTALDWPPSNPFFGVPHGPTLIKPWETMMDTGGEIRENPFAVVVSSPASAAAFHEARVQWESWGGDGQPHTGPNGSGEYYFPEWVLINYLVVPTVNGDPVIVLAPEVSRTVEHTRPLGHPTLGGCQAHGGAPLAFFGGELKDDDVITNHSGRFSAGSSTSLEHLENTAALFNCYGITVVGVEFQHPDDY
jgi:hypothetical protein